MYLSQETSIVISIYVHHQQAAILISRNKTKIAAVQLRQPKHRSALITLIKLLATGKGAPQLEIPPVTWHSCPIWQHPYRDEYFGVYILEHHYSTGRSFQDFQLLCLAAHGHAGSESLGKRAFPNLLVSLISVEHHLDMLLDHRNAYGTFLLEQVTKHIMPSLHSLWQKQLFFGNIQLCWFERLNNVSPKVLTAHSWEMEWNGMECQWYGQFLYQSMRADKQRKEAQTSKAKLNQR